MTGGCGLLGGHIVRLLSLYDGCTAVHVVDLRSPASPLPAKAVFHCGSIADGRFLASLIAAVRPATIVHCASLIDLRPETPARRAANDAVNVEATAMLLERGREHGASRFVYTSSLECGYHDNSSVAATEDTPYSQQPCNGYQRTKIAAERRVLEADSESLATVVIRPSHIFGHPIEDDLVRFLARVDVCFGRVWLLGTAADAATMSMCHVENCAAAHVLAAARCRASAVDGAPAVGPRSRRVCGRAFNVRDFDENIVCAYHAVGGTAPPRVCLPFWLLCMVVHVAIALHTLCDWLTLGRVQLLQPKAGLHHGALAAAKECTVDDRAARNVLGYATVVTRAAAIEAAARREQAPPLLGRAELSELMAPALSASR